MGVKFKCRSGQRFNVNWLAYSKNEFEKGLNLQTKLDLMRFHLNKIISLQISINLTVF